MICPHLKRTVMPICRAKKGALTAPSICEPQSYCISVRYKECPLFKKNRPRKKGKTEEKKKDKDKDTTVWIGLEYVHQANRGQENPN